MIDPNDLNYFVELTKTQHLTRAAERLGLSQPALSHCIKRMEAQLKTKLFLRSKKGVQLTAAGKTFLENAEHLQNAWQHLTDKLHDQESGVRGKIPLGCHSALALYMLPAFVGPMLAAYPELELSLQHGLSRHMTEGVVSGHLHAALAVNPLPHPDLIIKEICRDEVTLWRSKKSLNKDVLIMEPNLIQTQDIFGKLHKKGIHFKRVIESASLEVIANLVAQGVGFGILPERVLKAFGAEKYERLKDAPVFHDRICLVYKQEFRKTERGRIFIEAVLSAKV